MNWKTFVKPDAKRVLLAVILFAMFSYFAQDIFPMGDVIFYGFPLSFYTIFTMPTIEPTAWQTEISYTGFLIDLAVWYAIACIMTFVFEKPSKTAARGRKK